MSHVGPTVFMAAGGLGYGLPNQKAGCRKREYERSHQNEVGELVHKDSYNGNDRGSKGEEVIKHRPHSASAMVKARFDTGMCVMVI